MINLNEIEGFEWDTGNQNKNFLKHKVSGIESEEIFNNEPFVMFQDAKHSNYEPRYLGLGKTNLNRRLSVSFTIRAKKIRIISARDMSRKERSIYNEKEI